MAAPAHDGGSLGRGARLRILAAARTLFARQGMGATSVNELRAAARVSKRTLYEHFSSKDDLLLAYLEEISLTGPVAAVLGREQLAPRARLLEFLATLADENRPTAPDPVLAAATEFPDPDHRVHRAAAEQGERLLARLHELAAAAGATDPDQVARRLALVYAGAAARVLLDDPAAVVADAHGLAALILRDAIDRSGTDRST